MNKIFWPNALSLFPFLFGMALFSMSAWAETGNDSNQQAIKPGTCVQEIVKLQEMLHAADQTTQSLMSRNKKLMEAIDNMERTIDNVERENRTLRETINKIRDESGGGGLHPLEKQGEVGGGGYHTLEKQGAR